MNWQVIGFAGVTPRVRCQDCGGEWWKGLDPALCRCRDFLLREGFLYEPTEEDVEWARHERRAMVVGWNYPYATIPLLRCPYCMQEEWGRLSCSCLDS